MPMTRRFILSLAFLVLSAPAYAMGDSNLTGKTLIDGPVVTVGDIFTNAGRHAGHVLAPAPDAGKNLVLSPHDLGRIAKAFRLDWQSKDNQYVTLERNATLIDSDRIIDALKASDLKDSVNSEAEFKLTNLPDGLVIDGKEAAELVVGNTSFDPHTEKFGASLQILRDDRILKEIRVEGQASVMVRVPVLKFPMSYNYTITAKDLVEVPMPKQQLRGDVITDKNELIGMLAKRGLQANQTLSRNDIVPPVMVKRNEMVTIIYKNGPIQLSSRARSLGVGSRGDSVMFMNMTSKKSFEAKVTGYQTAEVNLDG